MSRRLVVRRAALAPGHGAVAEQRGSEAGPVARPERVNVAAGVTDPGGAVDEGSPVDATVRVAVGWVSWSITPCARAAM